MHPPPGPGPARLETLCEELYELVASHNPVQLIPSIAAIGRMRSMGPGEDEVPHTSSWDAKVEYLAGLAVAGHPGSGTVDPEAAQKVLSLVDAVFGAAQAKLFNDAISERRTKRPVVEEMRFLFRLEHLMDRMGGYAIHIEEIADEVFAPHRDMYLKELGFCPNDAVRLVRRHTKWIEEQNGTRDELPIPVTPDNRWAVEMHFLLDSMEAGHIWSPDRLAGSTGLPVDQITALLRSMSTRFEVQTGFRRPFFDENKLRTHPLIRLPDGSYLAPNPWAVAHRIHDWMQDYILNNPESKLVSKYPKHRSDAAESLVRRGLESVFGESAVFANQHYDSSEGHGEVDCIVVGSTPILAEVKSHMLPKPARLGRPLQTKRLANKVVSKSFSQTRRARTYILEEGGRHFAEQRGQQATRLLSDAVTDAVLIAVTLERMDPLAMTAGALEVEDQPARIWVTNLSDFLMVRDVLDDPASFLHYATTRGVAFELGIEIYLESDALGEYLNTRLAPLIDQAKEYENYRHVLVDNRSAVLNNYFTLSELGLDLAKPDTGVPPTLRDALRTVAPTYPPAWTTVASAVMNAPPRTWRAWKHFLRRHKGQNPFNIRGTGTAIVTSPTLAHPELRNGDTPHLVIPDPRTGA